VVSSPGHIWVALTGQAVIQLSAGFVFRVQMPRAPSALNLIAVDLDRGNLSSSGHLEGTGWSFLLHTNDGFFPCVLWMAGWRGHTLASG
jgi:hypothetical protein